jgi:tetratricopeptide (TPR) repeat protein
MAQVQVRLLQPADVTLPAEVKRLAVVDRSAVGDAGEGVLSVVEGIFTNEAILGDREGAEEAVEELLETLAASPRFDAVPITAGRKAVSSSLFDEELDFETVQRLCEDVGAQALVSLDYFDSDTDSDHDVRRTETTNSKGDKVVRTIHDVSRTTEVTLSWRVYDASQSGLLDEQSKISITRTSRGSAATKKAAWAELPDRDDTIESIGEGAGRSYGRRIAPSYVLENRLYYGDKDDRLKDAAGEVKEDRWDQAEALWRRVLDDPDPKLAGRAAYNLALSLELGGLVDEAVDMVNRAVELLDNDQARRYRATLIQRARELTRLDSQMQGTQ